MKKLLLLFLATGIATWSFANDETPFLTKNFKSSSINSVEVSTSGGGITVFGGSETETTVEVYVRANNSSAKLSHEEIESRLENYLLKIEKEGNRLVCTAKPKGKIDWKKGLSISFKLNVPQKVATDLATSGGGITMKNLKGDLKFSTSGGGLSLTDLGGTVIGSTSGGGITLTNCDDKVKVTTSGGGIVARGCDGEIELRTSGGGITVEDLNGYLKAVTSGGGVLLKQCRGEIVASTSGGSMDLQDIKGNVSATTSAGGIRADILQVDDYVTLSSSAGNVIANLPNNKGMTMDLSGNNVELEGFGSWNGKKERDSFMGSVNGGGAKVKISANAGHVVVR